MILQRRNFLIGIIAASAAPAIVRAGSLMPIKAPKLVMENLLPEALGLYNGPRGGYRVGDYVKIETREPASQFQTLFGLPRIKETVYAVTAVTAYGSVLNIRPLNHLDLEFLVT